MNLIYDVKKKCIGLIGIIGVFLLSIILYESVFYNVRLDINLDIKFKILIYIIGSMGLYFGVWKYKENIDRINDRKIDYIKWILICCMLCLQCIVIIQILQLKAYPKTDLAVAVNSAIDMQENYFFPHNSNILRYPQNHFLILILYYFYKMLNFFQINGYWECSIILNFFMVNISFLFSYLIVKLITNSNKRKELFFVILSVLNPFMYFWFPYFYTTILVIPFMMSSIYIWILAIKKKEKFFIFSVLSGGLAAIGFEIRVVAFIPIIALIINMYFDKNEYIIDKIKHIFCFTITFCICIFLMKYAINLHKLNMNSDTEFPISHYIMMGLNEEGRYSEEDVKYTESFETKEEKIAANIEVIKSRIQELGASGLINLAIKKLSVTWADGSNGYTDWYSQKYTIQSGQYKDILLLYSQVYKIFISIMILMYYWNINKDSNQNYFPIGLSLIGAILFYIGWESNSKYSVPFTFIIMILATHIVEKTEFEIRIIKNIKISILAIFIALITLFQLKNVYKNAEIKEYEYIINQDYKNSYITEVNTSNYSVEQTFKTNKSFNKVLIGVNKMYDIKRNLYIFELWKEEKLIYSIKFGGENTNYTSNYIEFSIDEKETLGGGSFAIQIKGIGADKDNLSFAYENNYIDYLPNSDFYLNNNIDKKNDLLFIVMKDKKQ